MVEGLKDRPQFDLRIDRDKAQALGVSFDAINAAWSTAFGPALIHEFENAGRMQRVMVQDQPNETMHRDRARVAPKQVGAGKAPAVSIPISSTDVSSQRDFEQKTWQPVAV